MLFSGLWACGPKEGRGLSTLDGGRLDLAECSAGECDEPELCAQLYFDYGPSPALCIERNFCDVMQCQVGHCALINNYPVQVKCLVED